MRHPTSPPCVRQARVRKDLSATFVRCCSNVEQKVSKETKNGLLEFKLQLVSGKLKLELRRKPGSNVDHFDTMPVTDSFGELLLAEVVRCPPIF